jgi:hypothetical protein
MRNFETDRAALKPMADAGLQRTAAALKKATNEEWSADSAAIEPFHGGLGLGEKEAMYAVHMGWPGASALMLLPLKSAIAVGGAFLKRNRSGKAPIESEFGDHVLAELANVVVHGAANYWADACDVGVLLTQPQPLYGTSDEIEQSARDRVLRGTTGFAATIIMTLSCKKLASQCVLKFFLVPAFAFRLARAKV